MNDAYILRQKLHTLLGIPSERCDLAPESRGIIEHDGVVIEKWIWTSEPGSRVTSVLYRPKNPTPKMPAMVITCGHGGSKSQWQYVYVPLLYAHLGLACLVLDPIGEEERHISGGMGTRAHDPEPVHSCADQASRLIMGKLVFDTMRGIDFLLTRSDIDPDHIGVAGNSLGGAKATWMLALDTRLRLGLVSGWGYGDHLTRHGKFCTRIPNQRMREHGTWDDFLSLPAPHCAVLILNGDADTVIDDIGDSAIWEQTRKTAETVSARFPASHLDCWFEPQGGHRPYHGNKIALEWIHNHLGTPGMSLEKIQSLGTLNAGLWCDRNNISLEKLYGTTLHQRGTTLPDLNLTPIPKETLACLRHHEIGDPQYTLEGWLDTLQK
jgi:dienelactone hydrolase